MRDDDFDEHLQQALIGGLEQRKIVIAAYDSEWPLRFEIERHRILNALGNETFSVHHIGSTAVPGLAAKPIIDMILVGPDPDEESTYVPTLQDVGYALRVREPGHTMLRTGSVDVHLHCWNSHTDIERHLLFRDWLRVNETDRRRYETLKRQLSEQNWLDTNYYSRAKSNVIEEMMMRARAWDAKGRPVPQTYDESI